MTNRYAGGDRAPTMDARPHERVLVGHFVRSVGRTQVSRPTQPRSNNTTTMTIRTGRMNPPPMHTPSAQNCTEHWVSHSELKMSCSLKALDSTCRYTPR